MNERMDKNIKKKIKKEHNKSWGENLKTRKGFFEQLKTCLNVERM